MEEFELDEMRLCGIFDVVRSTEQEINFFPIYMRSSLYNSNIKELLKTRVPGKALWFEETRQTQK